MANDGYKKAFDGLLKSYLSLDDSAETIVRQLKKTPNPDNRSKIIAELRNLEKKRLELLNQMDSLGDINITGPCARHPLLGACAAFNDARPTGKLHRTQLPQERPPGSLLRHACPPASVNCYSLWT